MIALTNQPNGEQLIYIVNVSSGKVMNMMEAQPGFGHLKGMVTLTTANKSQNMTLLGIGDNRVVWENLEGQQLSHLLRNAASGEFSVQRSDSMKHRNVKCLGVSPEGNLLLIFLDKIGVMAMTVGDLV